MNNLGINIWGREFDLEVILDCYKGEQVLPFQEVALECFLAKIELISEAKTAVEEYCIKRNAYEIGAESIGNIFKYVIPKSIFVKRTRDQSHVVGLMCTYKFNLDDGIAVVFKNEQFLKVGSQNIIL